MVDQTMCAFGRIDYSVNSAGVSRQPTSIIIRLTGVLRIPVETTNSKTDALHARLRWTCETVFTMLP